MPLWIFEPAPVEGSVRLFFQRGVGICVRVYKKMRVAFEIGYKLVLDSLRGIALGGIDLSASTSYSSTCAGARPKALWPPTAAR